MSLLLRLSYEQAREMTVTGPEGSRFICSLVVIFEFVCNNEHDIFFFGSAESSIPIFMHGSGGRDTFRDRITFLFIPPDRFWGPTSIKVKAYLLFNCCETSPPPKSDMRCFSQSRSHTTRGKQRIPNSVISRGYNFTVIFQFNWL